MTTLILKVDIPEGNKLPAKLITVDADGKITGSEIEVVELPTEEEIEKAWFTYDDDQKEDAYLLEQGAKWYRDEILNKLK